MLTFPPRVERRVRRRLSWSSCLLCVSPRWPRPSRSGRWARRRSSPNCERAQTLCGNNAEVKRDVIATSIDLPPTFLSPPPMIRGVVQNCDPVIVYLIVVSSTFQRQVRAQGPVRQLPPGKFSSLRPTGPHRSFSNYNLLPGAGAAHGPREAAGAKTSHRVSVAFKIKLEKYVLS